MGLDGIQQVVQYFTRRALCVCLCVCVQCTHACQQCQEHLCLPPRSACAKQPRGESIQGSHCSASHTSYFEVHERRLNRQGSVTCEACDWPKRRCVRGAAVPPPSAPAARPPPLQLGAPPPCSGTAKRVWAQSGTESVVPVPLHPPRRRFNLTLHLPSAVQQSVYGHKVVRSHKRYGAPPPCQSRQRSTAKLVRLSIVAALVACTCTPPPCYAAAAEGAEGCTHPCDSVGYEKCCVRTDVGTPTCRPVRCKVHKPLLVVYSGVCVRQHVNVRGSTEVVRVCVSVASTDVC
jgi:hypothetical protein